MSLDNQTINRLRTVLLGLGANTDDPQIIDECVELEYRLSLAVQPEIAEELNRVARLEITAEQFQDYVKRGVNPSLLLEAGRSALFNNNDIQVERFGSNLLDTQSWFESKAV